MTDRVDSRLQSVEERGEALTKEYASLRDDVGSQSRRVDDALKELGRLGALEARLDAANEKIREADAKTVKLEDSAQKFSTAIGIVGALAVIFLGGGAYGLTAFRQLSESVEGTSEAVKKAKEEINSHVDKREGEARKRLALIAQNVEGDVNKAVSARFGQLDSWGPAPANPAEAEFSLVNGSKMGTTGAKSCPPGQYLVGLRLVDTDGGGACFSCISGVVLICRPLNSKEAGVSPTHTPP